jgi:hypothetical protein
VVLCVDTGWIYVQRVACLSQYTQAHEILASVFIESGVTGFDI